MYARMMIVEILDDEAFRWIRQELSGAAPELASEPGYQGHAILLEDSGRVLVFITVWKHREGALRFGLSVLNRRLLSRIDSGLVGGPVVKLFSVHGAGAR